MRANACGRRQFFLLCWPADSHLQQEGTGTRGKRLATRPRPHSLLAPLQPPPCSPAAPHILHPHTGTNTPHVRARSVETASEGEGKRRRRGEKKKRRGGERQMAGPARRRARRREYEASDACCPPEQTSSCARACDARQSSPQYTCSGCRKGGARWLGKEARAEQRPSGGKVERGGERVRPSIQHATVSPFDANCAPC